MLLKALRTVAISDLGIKTMVPYYEFKEDIADGEKTFF